jgi:hypothetical protein
MNRAHARAITGLAAVLIALTGAAPASAEPLEPYDGRKPFRCDVQRVGTGTDFPAPKADPFCVGYDKRNQNVAALGIVDFLAQEPARVAAVFGKCFYLQRDKWRSSVYTDGSLEIYNWRGSYFIDLAAGIGGAYVKKARALGYGGDPEFVDLAPDFMADFVHPTGAGGMMSFRVPADPACAERVATPAQQRAIYRKWYLPTATG